MSKLTSLWSIVRKHKYLITVVGFLVLIVFIDENSLVRRAKYEVQIREMRQEIEKYKAAYEESTERLNELMTNPEAIERIAREKYLMKKPNEDIFVTPR
ncbi:septum formation initiator family protein [Bacteroides sp. 214]|uniref:FtsB family cell division protein n=1 Tax=Bacteroides sp. 214 TaxID=2302935 RepID=UPI0013D2EAE7|nr:septum formation initiator family protein [Bacteroides sp. 214]NDW11650.1 septum formation initiator family protein [Bacteroides sp. 214]